MNQRTPKSNKKKRKKILLLLLAGVLLLCCLFPYAMWEIFFPFVYYPSACSYALTETIFQNYSYMSEIEYFQALGCPTDSRTKLAEVYAPYAPIERDAYLPNEKKPHHAFFEIAVPEKGFSLRQHNDLWMMYKHQELWPDQVIITGEHIRFGWLDIGVGSPKWKVRLAYAIEPEYDSYNVASRLITSHRLLPEERAEDFSLGYRIGYRDMTDNGIDVLFRFDENNRVDMMVLNFASGMP